MDGWVGREDGCNGHREKGGLCAEEQSEATVVRGGRGSEATILIERFPIFLLTWSNRKAIFLPRIRSSKIR
jgi:hypothetical protein